MRVREIGSDFHLPLRFLAGFHRKTERLPLEGPITFFLASGRDALHWIIHSLNLEEGTQVLLPSYLCDEVLKPFTDNGLEVRFYRISKDLQIDTKDLLEKLSPETRVLLYIHYLGFPSNFPVDMAESVSAGTLIIEDSSHSFLSCLSQPSIHGDIRFATFRKLLPVPNGAAVSFSERPIPGLTPVKTKNSPQYMGALFTRCAGSVLKTLWLSSRGIFPKAVFRQFFSWSESLLDTYTKPAQMAAISRHVLKSMDLRQVAQARRDNFNFLLESLKNVDYIRPLYTELSDGVCPLGFPVLTEKRDDLVRHLIKHRIYPPIHWKLPNSVDRAEFYESWYISEHILTLPIDQRYDLASMSRIVEAIASYPEGEHR
jgi:dTDP-4-amino-4,6-dideoxygalactose transaminase